MINIIDERKRLKKSISIVIPVFNESLALFQMTESIFESIKALNQKYGFEIIFVDDGSKDDSWAVIRKISEKWGVLKEYPFLGTLEKNPLFLPACLIQEGTR